MGFADILNKFYETIGRVLVGSDFELHKGDKVSKNNVIDNFLEKRKQKKLERAVEIATAHIEKAKRNAYLEASTFVIPPNSKEGYLQYHFPMRSVFVMYGFKDRETDAEVPKNTGLDALLCGEQDTHERYTTQAKEDLNALSPEEKDKAVAELLQPYAFLGSTGFRAERYHALIRRMFNSDYDITLNKAIEIAKDICAAGPMADFSEIFEYRVSQYDDEYE